MASFSPLTYHSCAAVRTSTKILLLLCTVFAVPLAARQAIQQPATAHFKQGKLLFQKKDFAGAIESYSKAIELRQTWAEAYLERGVAKRMSGQLAGAIADFDKATELDPKTTRNNRPVAQAYTNHGQILAQQGQLDDAVTDFDKAIKLSAMDFEPYYERGQARLLQEDFEGALADYSSFLVKEQHDDFSRSRAFLERGLVKKLLHRENDGVDDTKEALRLAGKLSDVLLGNLDMLLFRLKLMRDLRALERKPVG